MTKKAFDNRAIPAPSSKSYHPHFHEVTPLKHGGVTIYEQRVATRKFMKQADRARAEIKLALARGAQILEPVYKT